MVKGLGTDIIEIGRVDRVIKRYGRKFLDRLFSQKEQEYCFKHQMSARNFAGRFAGKEAVSKALGKGIGEEIHWLDIEILNDATGSPQVYFSERLSHLLDHTKMALSISHCKEYATAVAIWWNFPQSEKG